MKSITKQNYDFLIKNNLMPSKKGYTPGYITGTKCKHGKSKSKFVEDEYFYKLYPKLKSKEKNKINWLS